MTVEINISQIIAEIRRQSHREVASIADPDARYKAEAGSEKVPELKRLLITANAEVYDKLQDYLEPGVDMNADNQLALGETLSYPFIYSDRRFGGKAQSLTDAIHAYLLDRVLADYYASVAQTALSQVRMAHAADDMSLLNRLVHSKRIPRL